MRRLSAIIFFVLVVAFVYAHWPDEVLPEGTQVDAILVLKGERKLMLLREGRSIKEYVVALGGNPAGHKLQEGDKKTPEGSYLVDYLKIDSSFHRALHISYPNETDRANAKSKQVDPGGLIMIHGLRSGLGIIGRLHRFVDWTNGCIAVTNAEIEEIIRVVPIGTPIEIRP